MIWIILIWYLCYRVVYTGYAKGSTVVRVRCEGCDRRYKYRMRRSASFSLRGNSSLTPRAMDGADDRAEDMVDYKLDTEFDCVPCPHCGDYQPQMVEQLKDKSIAWTKNWIVAGFVVAALLLLFGIPIAIAAAAGSGAASKDGPVLAIMAVAACGPGVLSLGGAIYLVASRGRFRDNYDPNDPAGADDRKEIGEDRDPANDD